MILRHNYNNLAGQTVSWDTSDCEKTFQENLKNPINRAILEANGFLDNPITYQFNTHGFRNPEFDTKIDVACFGCSFTMGTGVHVEHTWPSQLQKLTGLRVANLGHAGSSNDTAFRFAKHYLPLLSPKWAVWVQTDRHRLELLDDSIPVTLNIIASDTSNPCAQDYFIKTWFATDENQQLNLEKNTMAFEHLCEQLGIISVILPRNAVWEDGRARDLIHPGAKSYKQLANQVKNLLGQLESIAVK